MLNSFYHRLNDRFPALGNLLWKLAKGPVRRTIRGKGNVMKSDGAHLSAVRVDIIGDNNQIIIGAGSRIHNLTIHMRGSGHRLEIGRDCWVERGGQFWLEDRDGLLQIGDGTTIVEAHIAVTEPGSKVVIGRDCMFANDIDVRTGDSHAILEAQTGERINPARDVVIGDHVWIGAHAVILKGVELGANSVVATGAVVTKSCPAGVILAGNPANIIKTGITWKRERTL